MIADGRATRGGMESDDLLCSRNARPQKDGEGSRQTILLARGTRTIKRIGRTPMLVLCSRNARPEKDLVRRPHVDHMGALPREGKQASSEGYI